MKEEGHVEREENSTRRGGKGGESEIEKRYHVGIRRERKNGGGGGGERKKRQMGEGGTREKRAMWTG
jgi:hypothetical protein